MQPMKANKLNLQRPQIMGILNITSDSFSDGGQYTDLDNALAHATQMSIEGASIIDIGAESTRPGATPITAAKQITLLLPIIQAIRDTLKVHISIDTSLATVMSAVIDAGVDMINDVTALSDKGAIELIAQANIPVCLMHMQGGPRNMQDNPQYSNVVTEVTKYLRERANTCIEQGILVDNIIVDPGFGFGKTLQHNMQLADQVEEIINIGYPTLIGVSRKSMLGVITGKTVEQRLPASLAITAIALYKNAKIIRTHDVAATHDVLKTVNALKQACV